MGAAMLKRHQFVWSIWALYRLVVSSITFVCHLYVGESGAALVACNTSFFIGNMENRSTRIFKNCLTIIFAEFVYLLDSNQIE